MQKSLLNRFWHHKMFVSVAWSDTGAARGFHLNTKWLFFAGAAMLGVVATPWVMPMHTGSGHGEGGHGGVVDVQYQQQISRISEEKDLQEKQLKIFARELGVLQARLDRFDAIGEKLFSDPDLGEHLQDVDELAGKGSATAHDEIERPNLKDLTAQITALSQHTDKIEAVMEAGLQIVASNQMTLGQKPSLWPAIHKRTYVSSNYGWRYDPFGNRKDWHGGIDLTGGYNAPIVSSADGVVVFAGYRYNYGIMVEIRHAGGFATRYAHLNKAAVKNGAQVKAGELIGLMGSTGRSTGPHLHFEVLLDDTKVNPGPFIKHGKAQARQLARQGFAENKLAALSTK